MECKEAYDPNNPENFGVIQHQQVGSPDDLVDNDGFEREKQMITGASLEQDDEDFSEMKEKDDILIEKLNAVEKKIEEKHAILDHTFGKKGRALEEEIRDLVEERNSLSEKKRRPLYRKEILEDRLRDEGQIDQIMAIAEVAKRCLSVKREKRPTMKEVTKDLKELMVSKHPWIKKNEEETEILLMKPMSYDPSFFGYSGANTEGESSDSPVVPFIMMR